ncbi:16S rRNA (cytosine(967)-C(5))-methyltransferase RsmB [Paraferrimonas sp. SM1919]|uniref:16S rRNA (cytosine(967)-C(5))-methyltransferase RsmB n=1 Tax=Paraferrimonas sp. SM1919 TaxID=2662263 RepID=UPI0013D3BB46|nr:16S rRNA (cytosine(967)-C(5))-methyltransferase RsmB [Paraferrimonas sp. SM1919]
MNVRALAAKVCFAVIDQGQSLTAELPKAQAKLNSAKDKGLLAELCYGVMRQLVQLDDCIRGRLSKALTGKKRVVHHALMVGVYQLYFTRIPAHAAVAETVEAVRQLRHPSLTKLCNGVLRTLDRERPELQTSHDTLTYNHPGWFIKKVQTAYPDKWQSILDANNQKAPMWLRASRLHNSRDQYLQLLSEQDIAATAGNGSDAILLEQATTVERLPGFDKGWASVQDIAAQASADILDPQPGERVLDACAAPGGKTCHLLEVQPQLKELIAIDADATRLSRIEDNLQRLNLTAKVVHADATDLSAVAAGEQFDRILLDAPCSATGVIRRHPDIKWLRRADDIAKLVQLQSKIFDECWQWLKPGGTLVYATCSILPEENSEQVQAFIERHQDAKLVPISQSKDDIGWQRLPNQDGGDGFYYAKLVKQ